MVKVFYDLRIDQVPEGTDIWIIANYLARPDRCRVLRHEENGKTKVRFRGYVKEIASHRQCFVSEIAAEMFCLQGLNARVAEIQESISHLLFNEAFTVKDAGRSET